MLVWSLIFFAIAIIAALFGFGGAASTATSIAQFIFYIFAILLALSLVASFIQSARRK
ncbi:DUF1328 family protein [Alteromonas halophila]|uniref:UPF0391 membrane protein GCM10007391_21720 n=1 Tax=Alteromonas halophila TaxID=516698 RepID=A0A918MYB3_9ALTE|nr:DUF1328 family protein [Alteromonas halophila]GGW87659.1 hypothetical protein GCM10007391_21720 [Alteromonas halophila]